MSKKGDDLEWTLEDKDPYEILGISIENAAALSAVTAAQITRAYRRMALKLHPDKNPDGPEPFLKMQRAYQALIAEAQGEAEIGGGPRPQRLSLLLRAQVQYQRFVLVALCLNFWV